jgi:hypothetical protein
MAEKRISNYHHQDEGCMFQAAYPCPAYKQPHLHPCQKARLVLSPNADLMASLIASEVPSIHILLL